MRITIVTLLLLFGLCIPNAHAQMASPGSAYATDVSLQFVDNTANCVVPINFYSYPSCFASLTGPVSGAALTGISSGYDGTTLATDAPGNVYQIKSAAQGETDVRFKPVTGLSGASVHQIVVSNINRIYALIPVATGCPTGTYGIFQANAGMTGWTRVYSGYCPTFITVASDGTLGQIRSDTHTARFLKPGTTLWITIPGSWSHEMAIVDVTMAYLDTPTGTYQIDLTNPTVQTLYSNIAVDHMSVREDNILWWTLRTNVFYEDFSDTNPGPKQVRGNQSAITAGMYTMGTYNGVAYNYINYALEVVATTHGQYTGTCVPPPGGSPCVHTATSKVSFDDGGENGTAGVTATKAYAFNGAINTAATERSMSCDSSFAPTSKRCLPKILGQIVCSIGGIIFTQPVFDFEIRDAITNSKYVAGSQNTLGPMTYCAVNDNCLPGSGPMGSPPFASYDHVFIRPLRPGGPKRPCAAGYITRSICERNIILGVPQPWGCTQQPLSIGGEILKDTSYATDATAKACTGPRSYYDKYPAPF
jgi:hypothetical protein